MAMKPAPRTEPPTTTTRRTSEPHRATVAAASRSLLTHSRNCYLDRPVGPLPERAMAYGRSSVYSSPFDRPR